MGLGFSRIFDMLWGREDIRIMMVGLDAAGKTTILYKLQLGKVVTTIPTIGFNLETVTYKNITFTIWDTGGQDKIRPLWRCYFHNGQGYIFVVDSCDADRIAQAKEELHIMLRDANVQDKAVLILANKQDMPGAMDVADITEKLGLEKLGHGQWHIQPTCALSGEGLHEGLDWLATAIRRSGAR